MPIDRKNALVCSCLLLLASCDRTPRKIVGDTVPRGLVIESLAPSSDLFRAGLRTGDILLDWHSHHSGEATRLDNYFDWWRLHTLEASRGPVRLRVRRREELLTTEIPPGRWYARIRPSLPDHLSEHYREGQRRLDLGDYSEGVDIWLRMAADHDASQITAWLRLHAAETLAMKGQQQRALAVVSELTRPRTAADRKLMALHTLAQLQRDQGDYAAARRSYRAALALADTWWPDSLVVAELAGVLGRLEWQLGRRLVAEPRLRRARELIEAQAPDSLMAARNLIDLGKVESSKAHRHEAKALFAQALAMASRLAPRSEEVVLATIAQGRQYALDDLEEAEILARRGLVLAEAHFPDGLALVLGLDTLGEIVHQTEGSEVAEQLFRRALGLARRLDPHGLRTALQLDRLAGIARSREQLLRAEEGYLETLSILRRLDPGGPVTAGCLRSLGLIAAARGDLELAESYYREELEIRSRHGHSQASTLGNLGSIAWELGEWTKAETFFDRALAIKEARGHESLDLAYSLDAKAHAALRRRDLDRAEGLARRSLAIRLRILPDSEDVVRSYLLLGDIARLGDRAEAAREDFGKALRIAQKITAPQSEARATLGLAQIHAMRGEVRQAEEGFENAIDRLEDTLPEVGGSERTLSGYRALHQTFFWSYIDLLVSEGRWSEAFSRLETWRARSFRRMVAERRLSADVEVPEELLQRQEALGKLYGEALSGHRSQDAPVGEIARLRREMEQVAEVISRYRIDLSPRLRTVLDEPVPDVERARQRLDPGTALLAFHVGENRSHVFFISREEGVSVVASPVGAEELRTRVADLRSSIETRHPFFEQRAHHLYRLLIAPFEPRLTTYERLHILADGPLHELPFGALVRRLSIQAERAEYLVDWKPYSIGFSLTARARRAARPPATSAEQAAPELVAFGDPLYSEPRQTPTPGNSTLARRLRSLDSRGFSLHALPGSRSEVEAITRLFPNSQVSLGAAATEKALRSVPATTRFLHIAAHAFLDRRFPLASTLALATPEADEQVYEDGFLHAWEILADLELKVEMVVLSACSSGLGRSVGYEGLVGLVRAFQIAGARTVVASSWNVDDGNTAILMARFYEYLQAGRSKIEALRHTQLDALDGRLQAQDAGLDQERSWAAFQVYGDWQ